VLPVAVFHVRRASDDVVRAGAERTQRIQREAVRPLCAALLAMLFFCFVVPFTILANNRTRTIRGTLIASISVNIGMWLERFTIVVPSLSNPRAPVLPSTTGRAGSSGR